MNVEQRLEELGIALPTPAKPVAAYVPVRRVGDLLYVSGQLPFVDGTLIAEGAVPSRVSVETATSCAERCVINGLAAVKAELGELDRVAAVVRVGVWVASDGGFGGQPTVANGASELLVSVFGDAGRHARAAVGSVSLPLNTPVEVEMLLQVR